MPRAPRADLADALQRVQNASSKGVVQSSAIKRQDRELLQENGYLKDIFKGWYLLRQPADEAGESTAWYSHFWDFLSVYLPARFKEDYCLSAPSSFELHVGTNVVPPQVTVITGHGGKAVQSLPCNTSLLTYPDKRNLPGAVEIHDDMRIMPLALTLCRIPHTFYQTRPGDMEVALKLVSSLSELIRTLLDGKFLSMAERITGAYEALGERAKSKEIADAMGSAGYSCKPQNPFEEDVISLIHIVRPTSPYAARIETLYRTMRADVLGAFADYKPPGPVATHAYVQHVDDVSENDAYNSLSIEGYRVTPDKIHRIREGEWDPERDPGDRREAGALAAKGYLEAFGLVKTSIAEILDGAPPVGIAARDYQKWYRALFSESVKAGIFEPHHLAGYRHERVFIKGARHVPPPHGAVPDAMDALFRVLGEESEAIVRAVLGHFLFVFIHPYMDGNGRVARFLMNAFLASGAYPWTIVRVEQRARYLASLEAAAVERRIAPFAEFIRGEMEVDWNRE